MFGNLYLANPRAAEFTAEDEQLVTALAATAGFAIANARLFDETRMRQLWTASSAQIASSLLDTAERLGAADARRRAHRAHDGGADLHRAARAANRSP